MTSALPAVTAAGRAHPTRAMALLFLLPIAGALAFAFAMLGYPSDRAPMIGLAITTAVIALIPVVIDQARPAERRHLLLTLYCLFFIGHFVFPIFVHYALARGPTGPSEAPNAGLLPTDVVRGQWIALAGLAALLAGYALTPARTSATHEKRRRERDWPLGAILIVAVAMLGLGWTITVAGVFGLIPPALGSGFIGTLASSIIFGNALLTIAALRHRSRLAWLLLAVAVPVSSTLGFFTGSKRSTLIFPAIVVLTGMFLGGRLRARWLLAGALGLMLLYPVAQFYRAQVLQDNTLTIVDALSSPEYTFSALSDFVSGSNQSQYFVQGAVATSARLDTIGIASVIVRDTPRVSPFQDGRTLGLFFAAFIPRLVWPAKPEIPIGKWITATYGPGPHIDSWTGPSFIGDLYLNFGIPSVVLGMLVLGALLRLFHLLFLGPNATTAGILAATIVVAQIHIKQVGPVAHTLSSAAFAFGPLLVAHILVVMLTRSRRRAPPFRAPVAVHGREAPGGGMPGAGSRA